MGLGLVYNGLRLRPGDQIVSTRNDYYATDEALRFAAARTGAEVHAVALFDDVATVDAEEVVNRIGAALRPQTRVLALTWVHSDTGLKLPLKQIGELVAEWNRERDDPDRILLCVDGVHGFGVEDVTLSDLGCDFLMAGCHKWLFGPRGTGLIAGRNEAWRRLQPTIPSFTDGGAWLAWLEGDRHAGPTMARTMTPGGFKSFEHVWALAQAFYFHEAIGKANVAERTHALARQLKEGLNEIAGVTLRTPMADSLSAGIVSFDIDGLTAVNAVERLRQRGLIASVAPYATPHVRLTPSIRNSPEEVEQALREVASLVS